MEVFNKLLKKIWAILAVAFSGIGVAIWLNWNDFLLLLKNIINRTKSIFLAIISFVLQWWHIELIIILLGVIAYLIFKLYKNKEHSELPRKKGLQWILSLDNFERKKFLVLFWFPVFNLLESPRFKVVDKLIGMYFPFESTPIFQDLIEHQVLEYKQDITVEYYFKIDREVYKYYEKQLKELSEESRNNLNGIMKETRFDYLFDTNFILGCYKPNN